jgi:hypothetical protein
MDWYQRDALVEMSSIGKRRKVLLLTIVGVGVVVLVTIGYHPKSDLAPLVKVIGFKNSDTPLISLKNLTGYPISLTVLSASSNTVVGYRVPEEEGMISFTPAPIPQVEERRIAPSEEIQFEVSVPTNSSGRVEIAYTLDPDPHLFCLAKRIPLAVRRKYFWKSEVRRISINDSDMRSGFQKNKPSK